MEANEAMEQRERLQQAAEAREVFARRAAVVVGVFAALLAIATLLANSAVEDTILAQERATDTYNEYQADSLKQRLGLQNSQILAALGQQQQSAAAKQDSDKNQAKKEALLPKAREFEAERDRSSHKHRSYQFSEGAFQIAIVLASVAIVARLAILVFAGGAVGLAGILFLLNGITSVVKVGG